MGGGGIFGVILPFAAFFVSKNEDKAKIDNFPSRLHYKFTSGFLFMSTAILGLNDMFGKDIQCHSQEKPADKAVNQYCWISGTFTVPGRQDPGTGLAVGADGGECSLGNGVEMLWDGAGFITYGKGDGGEPCKQTINYYQWVPYMLVLQGLLFMLPHRLWKYLEEGKMKCIAEGVTTGNNGDSSARQTIINNIAKFIAKQNKTKGHVKYAASFMICQVLSLLNVLFNVFLLDVFFQGKFLDFGARWIKSLMIKETSHSVLLDVFPRMTVCDWHQRGTGGHHETTQYMCILATNIATEKIFIFLWFWFIVLFLITLGAICYYSILFYSRDITWRDHFLSIAVNDTKEFQEAKSDSERTKEEMCHIFLKNLPACKFFFLYLLGHNVDYCSLKEIVQKISDISSQPPGYNTTMKNRMSRQVSTVSSIGSGHLSIRHQGSLRSQMSVQSRPMLPAQTEAEMEMKNMKPVVPQPGIQY